MALDTNSTTWVPSQYLPLAAAQTWTQPSTQWATCVRHMNAYILVNIDSLVTAGGNIDIKVQSAPVLSTADNAWPTCGSVTGVTTAGPQMIKIQRTAATPLTGLLRLVITCNGASVTATVRADLLLKQQVPSTTVEWVKAIYLNFSGAGFQLMPADLWIDSSKYLNAYLLVTFDAISGSGANLTLKLQTAAAMSADANAWADVGSPITMGTSPANYDGRASVVNPPAGVLRLAYSAGAALSGVLRVQLVMKDS